MPEGAPAARLTVSPRTVLPSTFMASARHAGRMGDLRFERPYDALKRSEDPAGLLLELSDDDVVAALASASRHNDPYLANTLATEALNRIHRLRAAVRNLGEAVVTVDLAGRITFANLMAGKLLGVPARSLVGRGLQDATGLDEATALAAGLAGRTLAQESSLRRPDGSTLPVACTVAPVYASSPEEGVDAAAEGVVLAFSDATERKRAEADLRLRATLLDALGEAVVATDPESRVRMWNPAAEALFGWSAQEALGRDAVELLIPPGSQARAFEAIEQARGGPGWTGAIFARRKDGSSMELAVTLAPLRDEDGALAGLVAVATDITDRRRAEEEARFRATVLESVGEAVTALDEHDRYVYWNAAAERLTGWGRDEVLGRSPRDVVVPAGSFRDAAGIAAGLRRGEPWTGTGRIRRKDGSTFLARVTAAPVRDARGHVFRVVGTWADVTQEVRAREALESARGFLQSTLDAITLQVAILDESGAIVAVNRAWRGFAEQNGLALADHGVGANYLAECDRAAAEGLDGAAEDAEGIRSAIRGETHEYLREYPCHAPHEKRWFVLRASGFVDAAGKRFGVVTHANVSSMHRAMALGHVLAAVVGSSSLATFATTLEGETLVWNEQATQLFGYSAKEALERPIDRLLDGTASEDKAAIREKVDRGEVVHLPRARCRGPGGRDVVVDLTLTPVRDAEGEIVAVSALAKPADGPRWD